MKCSLCVTIFSVIHHKNRNLAIQGIPAPHRDRFEVKYLKIIIFWSCLILCQFWGTRSQIAIKIFSYSETRQKIQTFEVSYIKIGA